MSPKSVEKADLGRIPIPRKLLWITFLTSFSLSFPVSLGE